MQFACQKNEDRHVTPKLWVVVMLFCWPTARAVWPNYEVVLFQPWSGTDPSPGSVANFTSYLNPDPPFNYLLGILPSPYVPLLPSHPPHLDWAAPLFFRPTPPLLFRSWINFPPGQSSTTAGLHRPSLWSMPCHSWPDSRVSLGACNPAPWACYCRLFRRMFAPLSPPLTFLLSLTTPVGAIF